MIWMICAKDPAFKLACGRLPEGGDESALPAHHVTSCWENAPDLRTLIRMTGAMVGPVVQEDCRRAPKAITLDIDDTADTVHGHQQLSMFNAHYDKRCFLADPCL